ncbi:EC45 protein [Colletotrichum higginsianum IMI 349063]|uniref:EC45 protein n=1 Tax=Colletotrichum higginsianum (strain IMI 349063) TaxID=759273 RepID=A0A1B7Y0E5_COLHI|nr:EC45 protein [Colletotrichum higginsianum IMI 349063]OBR05461.1 EC45 protein [Colletotrichum higginsianum IMI 349063]GJD00100.1 EC45 protein [Colletotrichum higginsianum]
MKISVLFFTSALVAGVLAAPIGKTAPADAINIVNDDIVEAPVNDVNQIEKREKMFEGGGGRGGGGGGARGSGGGGKGKSKKPETGTGGSVGNGGSGGMSKPKEPVCKGSHTDSIRVGC